METTNILEGKWSIVETQIYNNGWEVHRRFRTLGFVMEFEAAEQIGDEFRGMFVDQETLGGNVSGGGYSFNPTTMTLFKDYAKEPDSIVHYTVEIAEDIEEVTGEFRPSFYLNVQNEPSFPAPYYRLLIARQ